jgi:hypothetical protein
VKELIPALQQLLFVTFDQCSDPVNILSPKAVASFQSDGTEPEFRLAIVALDVDMGWLTAVTGVKEDAEGAASQDGRHLAILAGWLARDNRG